MFSRLLNLTKNSFKYLFFRITNNRKASYDTLLDAVEEMGGVYIKLMQFLSLRSDLFPEAIKLRLLTFYDQVPVEDIDINQVLETELGSELLQNFTKIEAFPFASGAFGQVYKAQLASEKEVIIKVKRAELKKSLSTDFIIINILGYLANLIFAPPLVDIPKLIKEFKEITYKELDYLAEVNNALYLYNHYQDHPVVHIPYTYKDLSTQNIIVQDFVGGIAITDLLRLKKQGVDYKQYVYDELQTDMHFVMKRLSYDSLWQIFSLEKFYSDPHPGNVKVLPNNKYAFIDFGILAPSPTNKRDYFNVIKFLSAGADRLQTEDLGEQMLSIGAYDLYKCINVYDRVFSSREDKLSKVVLSRYGELIDGWKEQFKENETKSRENFTKVWIDLFLLGERFNMKLPPGLFSGLRASALIKSLTSALDPDFQPMTEVFNDIASNINEQQLLNRHELDSQDLGVEQAVETVSNWYSSLAEVDVMLYQDLTNLVV